MNYEIRIGLARVEGPLRAVGWVSRLCFLRALLQKSKGGTTTCVDRDSRLLPGASDL